MKNMWYLNEFQEYLRSERLSDLTISNYRLHVGRFVHYCEDCNIKNCKTVSEDDVESYVHDVLDRLPHTPGWKYIATLCLKRYFAFLADHSLIFIPPVLPAKKPRYFSGSYQAIDKQQLRAILDTFPVNKASDIMAKAILELGYSAALRPGEIRRLKIEDIDFANQILFIEQSKGKKDRTVPAGKTALTWIRRYIREVRPNHLKEPAGRNVFIGMRSGKTLTDRAFTEFVAYRLKRAGLKRITLHQLRSSAATHMVDAGMNIGFVQQILGHTRLDTTQIYVQTHSGELKKILDQSHPRFRFEERRIVT
jgi:integrase/recombinase XerD